MSEQVPKDQKAIACLQCPVASSLASELEGARNERDEAKRFIVRQANEIRRLQRACGEKALRQQS